MYWIFLGSVISVLITVCWRVISELIVNILRIQYAEMYIGVGTPEYERICKSSYGLGCTEINFYGAELRYGMFLSLEFCVAGYIVPSTAKNDQTAHIWAFGSKGLNALTYRDRNSPYIGVMAVKSGNMNVSYTRVPSEPFAWQKRLINMILDRAAKSPSDSIVCIITGAPGMGKSTVPLLLYRMMQGTTNYVEHYKYITDIPWHMTTFKRSIIRIDEFDEVFKGVSNENYAPAVTKSDWNATLDHMHGRVQGPVIIMTTNRTYDQLRETGEHSESMLRPGRVDIIVHVCTDGNMSVIQQ